MKLAPAAGPSWGRDGSGNGNGNDDGVWSAGYVRSVVVVARDSLYGTMEKIKKTKATRAVPVARGKR